MTEGSSIADGDGAVNGYENGGIKISNGSRTFPISRKHNKYSSDVRHQLVMDKDEEFSRSRNGYSNGNENGSSSRNANDNLIRNVPLIENIVMGKENTVYYDEEHQYDEYASINCCSYCIGTSRLFRALAVAHIAAIMDNHKETLSNKKIMRRFYAIFTCCVFLLALPYIYFNSYTVTATPLMSRSSTRTIKDANNNFEYDSSIASFPDHHLESPIKLITSYIGENQQHQSNVISPILPTNDNINIPLEDRIWYKLGHEHPPNGVRLSPLMEDNLADTGMPWRASYVPLFWHVPRSAGGSVQEVVSSCLNLIQASDAGAEGHEHDQALEVVLVKKGGDGSSDVSNKNNAHRMHRYVNVDTMRMPGIQRAKNLGLLESDLARVVTTLFVQDVPVLFSPQHRGQLFTVVRHPVERAVSLFHYIRSSYHGNSLGIAPDTNLDDYARSDRLEFNWMTRFLTGRLTDVLTQDHVNLAKTIVRRKLVVGLFEEQRETFERFAAYFHWDRRLGDQERKCLDNLVFGDDGDSNKNYDVHRHTNQRDYPKLSPDSETWMILEEQNKFDMQLYQYAKIVFQEQAVLF